MLRYKLVRALNHFFKLSNSIYLLPFPTPQISIEKGALSTYSKIHFAKETNAIFKRNFSSLPRLHPDLFAASKLKNKEKPAMELPKANYIGNLQELIDTYLHTLSTEERNFRKMAGQFPFLRNSFKEDDEYLSRVLHQEGSELVSEKKFAGGIRLHAEGESTSEMVQRLQRDTVFVSSADLFKHLQAAKCNIPVKASDARKTGLVGQPVMRSRQNDGSKKIIPVPTEETLKVDVIISLGLDIADTEKGVSAGIREFNQLLFNVSEPEEAPQYITQFAYWPSLNRYQRYRDGLLYYYDNRYLNAHAEEFVSKYLMPRVFDKDGRLMPPTHVKPLLLCGYSLGARDNAIYLNAYVHHLSTYFDLDDETISLYLQRIFRLNIGAAVKWDKDFELTSPSLNFLSLNDMGILKPQDLFHAVYVNQAVTHNPVTVLHRPSEKIIKEYLVVLGHGQVPGSYLDEQQNLKSNSLGHSLPHYVKGIQKSAAAKYLELPRLFLDVNRTKPISQTCFTLFKSSKPYEIQHKPGLEEVKALGQQWEKYIENEKAIAKRATDNAASPRLAPT